MSKNLLFVVDERKMGGVSVVLNDLVHMLNQQKYNIDILVLHDSGNMLTDLPDHVRLIFGTPFFRAIDATLSEALKSHDLSMIFRKLRIVFGLKTGRILKMIQKERKKIIKKHYDVEIAYKDGFCALFTACGDTAKKVHWLHCSYKTFNPNEKYYALFKRVLPKFDRIIGVADNVVKEFNEIYYLEKLTEVIPVVMDIQRIKKMSAAQPLYGICKHSLNIVLVGRCHPVKGYDRLLDVVKRLKQKQELTAVCFTILGDGELFEHLKKRIIHEELDDVIRMVGNVKNPYAEMKQYDLLLLPSYSEAFGTVITEAFLVGVPVLSTKNSASLMSLKTGYGEICENNEQGIYMALKKILKNREVLHEYKANLQSFSYDNESLLERIEAIFDDEVIK